MIVILGHTGFIGSEIHSHLSRHGYETQGISSWECDLRDPDRVREVFNALPEGITLVFGAVINRHIANSIPAFEQNLRMVQNIASIALTGQLASIVYLSSVDIYGYCPPLPVTEKNLPCPASYYGLAKLTSEYLLRLACSHACPLSVLRLPGVYGQGAAGNSVICRFIDQIRRRDPLTVYSDGSVLRDYVFVNDVAEIVEKLVIQPFSGVLNVATGHSLSIMQLIELIGNELGMRPMLEYAAPDQKAAGSLTFDITALNRAFPGLRMTDICQGIQSVIKASLDRQ